MKIEKWVMEILKIAEIAGMTQYNFLNLAGENLNIKLSKAHYKRSVRTIVENFLKITETTE